jgi:predicted DNA-binding protein with PD1-like motif
MKAKLMRQSQDGARTFALVFETGDEVIATVTEFAKQNSLKSAHLTAIGALCSATIAWFNPESSDYRHNPVNEQVEVASLIGNITYNKGEPFMHAHVVLGKQDGAAVGGHLVEAHVRPTLELFLTELPETLEREISAPGNLSLIQIPID